MDGQIPTPKTSLISRIHRWSHAHKSGLLFAAALAVIIGTGVTVLAIMYQAPVYEPARDLSPIPQKKKKEEPKFYSRLTGEEVANEEATKQQVTAIMLENSPAARPQSGLKAAGVVYEAVAEGGITRFVCLYQQSKPDLIGPVRSLRPYYVDWIAPYDAAIAHVGGSKKALDEVRNGSYKDIDQFFNAGTYWRSNDRYAPHNVYTNFERLDALNNAKGYTSSDFTGFSRKADEPSKQPNATSISVNVSSGTYNSSYAYDTESNSYRRSQGGAPHLDREAGQISPKTVVIIKVAAKKAFEDGWRVQMETTGSGQAYIFQDGTVKEATWHKPEKRTQLAFKDAEGNDVALNIGQTWITAIAPERSVTWQ